VRLDKLIESCRKELGLTGKEWLCRNCRFGVLPDEDVCGYVTPKIIRPRICIYVQMRMQLRLLLAMGPPEDED